MPSSEKADARRLGLLGINLAVVPFLLAAAPAEHAFTLTYEDFGVVRSSSVFTPGPGYALRFEGCYAKKTVEAVCGFTLKAEHAMVVTNKDNLSHAVAASGEDLITCCMFTPPDPRGWPIRKPGALEPAAGVLHLALAPGESRPLMLRVPEAATKGPVARIHFSAGDGDPGISFPTRVVELRP